MGCGTGRRMIRPPNPAAQEDAAPPDTPMLAPAAPHDAARRIVTPDQRLRIFVSSTMREPDWTLDA